MAATSAASAVSRLYSLRAEFSLRLDCRLAVSRENVGNIVPPARYTSRIRRGSSVSPFSERKKKSESTLETMDRRSEAEGFVPTVLWSKYFAANCHEHNVSLLRDLGLSTKNDHSKKDAAPTVLAHRRPGALNLERGVFAKTRKLN